MKRIALVICFTSFFSIVAVVAAQVNCPTSALYCDDFRLESDWSIVREDYGDIDNSISYQTDIERLMLDIGGRWDFAVAAPLTQLNAISYTISTTAQFTGTPNLNTWGMVFGAANDFDSYYRIILLYDGNSTEMQLQVRRIESHDPQTGTGFGPILVSSRPVSVPDSLADNTLSVKVVDATAFDVYVNGILVEQISGQVLPSESRFGVWASTDEYLGAYALFDIFAITSATGTLTLLPPTAVTVSGASTATMLPIGGISLVASGLLIVMSVGLVWRLKRRGEMNGKYS